VGQAGVWGVAKDNSLWFRPGSAGRTGDCAGEQWSKVRNGTELVVVVLVLVVVGVVVEVVVVVVVVEIEVVIVVVVVVVVVVYCLRYKGYRQIGFALNYKFLL
jgi:hypothetical protein